MLDDLYLRCMRQLPPDLAGAALRLPELLGLAPAGVGWGDAFKHDITLGAPSYFEEPAAAPREQLEHAVTAHMLAVIEAFGYDRIADGQVATTRTLERILTEIRVLRDDVAYQVDRDAPSAFRAADRESREAILAEHDILTSVAPVDVETYRERSLGKQAVGFPATLMLFGARGADDPRRLLVEQALRGVWLGLQFRDDVLDWEEDWERGGAWAVCIARKLEPAARLDPGCPVATARALVIESGAMQIMLELSRIHFEKALAAAEKLRAFRLADWARGQESELAELVGAERRHPGYAVRAHRLRFAMEILTA